MAFVFLFVDVHPSIAAKLGECRPGSVEVHFVTQSFKKNLYVGGFWGRTSLSEEVKLVSMLLPH